MRIVDSIMPMSDVEALAANRQKLRVAVTKTSAQGKNAQSSTPNLMSFSTDENSVWFNGKKYGVYKTKGLYDLTSASSNEDIKNALGQLAGINPVDFSSIDFLIFDIDKLNHNRIGILSSVSGNHFNVEIFSVSSLACRVISLTYSEGTYKIGEVANLSSVLTNRLINNIEEHNTENAYTSEVVYNALGKKVNISDVINELGTSFTNKPLSAAMGKRLQDEKLAKSDVVNNLTTTNTSKALSAAQGKVLNDRISGLGNVYRVKGTKANIEEVYNISAVAKLGDVWNIASAFTIGGKPYPANTNVVCIAEWSTSTTPQNNWDPLGGTVDLSTYVPKSDIVDNLSTSDPKKPLSAKQGLALATMITKLEDGKETYQLLKTFGSSTPSNQGEVDAILGPYSSFNAALNAGKIIHGIYKDGSNRLNAVAFSAFNDTTANRVRMYAMLDPSTMVAVLANHNRTNWISATIDEGPLGGGITIE